MAKPEDVRLGQVLIRNRWCTLRQINRGLEQQRKWREDGKYRPLGWILVQQENLDEEKLRVVLAELGVLQLTCPKCKKATRFSSYKETKPPDCSQCGDKLILDDYSSSFVEEKTPATPAARHDDASTSLLDVLPADDEEVSTSADDPIVAEMIGGCQVLSRIASGGMGVVYKAKQLRLGRSVAVKILSEELARDRKYVHRFIQEARSAAELNHGNIVHIFDVGETGGLFYIIMEFVDGSNLREILDAQLSLDPKRVVEISFQASQALKHAHARGIIHRDIKPENIMITREGFVKIADLGLAKKLQPEQDVGITNTKAIMGTPYYMAPEQVKDFRQVDGRSDIYSLGVTLFRSLSGMVPFDGRTPVEVMIKVVEGKRPRLSDVRPDIPEELEAMVDKMMHRDPEERFQNFEEVIEALEKLRPVLKASEKKPVSS